MFYFSKAKNFLLSFFLVSFKNSQLLLMLQEWSSTLSWRPYTTAT